MITRLSPRPQVAISMEDQRVPDPIEMKVEMGESSGVEKYEGTRRKIKHQTQLVKDKLATIKLPKWCDSANTMILSVPVSKRTRVLIGHHTTPWSGEPPLIEREDLSTS